MADGEKESLKGSTATTEPSDAEAIGPVFLAASKDTDLSATKLVEAVSKPIQKEAVRLKLSFRLLSGVLLVCALGLALFWAAASSSERHSITGQQRMTTIRGANRFTVDSLGVVRERLASKSDSTLYEFLVDHHDTEVLRRNDKNIVKEVIQAIEHESAQAALVLVVQLFSDVHAAWPRATISDKGKKRINGIIADLEKLEKVRVETLANKGGNNANEDEEDKVEAGLKAIQKELEQMRDFGQLEDSDDEKMFEDIVEMNSPMALASILRSALYVDECRSYLMKIDQVRIENLKGKPMDRKDLSGKGVIKKNDEKKATPVPTTMFIPSEQDLIQAKKALSDLAAFVDDKVSNFPDIVDIVTLN